MTPSVALSIFRSFNISAWSSKDGFWLKQHSWCRDYKSLWPEKGHWKGVRMQLVLSCLEEAVVAEGGSNVSPLKPLAESWTAKRETKRREVTSDTWDPGKFWGPATARERKPTLFGTFHISKKLPTVPEMSGWVRLPTEAENCHPLHKMPGHRMWLAPAMLESSCPDPRVRASFLFPQTVLEGEMDDRLHSWAHA